ncbi:ABC transporter permease [Aeromicrobium sp. CTD01-1L150]|uniref:ABC transporter permease n=1 Tax=Aeromicrobium sp. CTD01-1L150 TaxID=3341830 RepID=UPI0035C2098B
MQTITQADAGTPETVGVRSRASRSPGWRSLTYRYGIVGVWVLEIAVFAVLVPDTFLTAANITSLLSSQAALLVLALALVPTLTTGEIDLSIAGTMTVSATIAAQLNAVDGVNLWLSILAGLCAAAVVGLVNALLAVRVGVESIIVTLGMGTLLIGLSVWFSNSLTISGVSPEISAVLNSQLLRVNTAFYLALALGIGMWFVYRHTVFGRAAVFIGKSAEVARLSGLPVTRIKVLSFVATSLLAGLAGVIVIGIAGGLQPTSLQSLLLPAFAAAFLGSAIIDPGTSNPLGTVIAVLFLATGISGLVLLGMDTWIRDVFYGAAVVVAVTVSRLAMVASRKAAAP